MKKKTKLGLALATGTLLTGISLMVIPPILVNEANRKYIEKSKKKEIDYKNMGPEIVKKEK